ncbi:sterol desaturase [Blastomyces dermatitidis ATCC 18188]|uniref:Sterol desaturase n=1 Tax=Ajellomyces dermatitidis (strain ATCC 18188 / CBS 674.68) TaxID=653446 RepID=F2T4Z1_AJEDA|nr:sterol desaturase [Blastomyces dermatitidis ATCC 18188]
MLDLLLSIPVLSYLLIPAMSSYNTSLNIIFFYITWITLVLSSPPLKVEIVGTCAVRLLLYLVPSALFFLFNLLFPSAAGVIKAQGIQDLPAAKKGKRCWKRALKVAGWAVFNLLMSIFLQGLVEAVLTKVLRVKSAIRVAARLPLPWDVLKDLALGLVGREVLQYAIHRYILHSPSAYVAKCHDEWYHSLRSPDPLTAHYDHPLAYLLYRFIPAFLPAATLRFHLLTYLIFLAFISLEETFSHSGYSIMPTSFFIGGVARRADLHLLSKGRGNYGSWGAVDWICGTTVGHTGSQGEGDDEEHEVDIEDVLDVALEEPKRKVRGLRNRGRGPVDS